MLSKEELIAKAEKPARDAMELHPFYRGKMQTAPKCCIRDLNDFAVWYTPGVAAPCKAIQKNVSLSYEYTNKGEHGGRGFATERGCWVWATSARRRRSR